MRSGSLAVAVRRGAIAAGAALLVSCTTSGGGGGGPRPVAVAPFCAAHLITSTVVPVNDAPVLATRTDAAAFHGFTRFGANPGPRGNSLLASTTRTYAIREAWLRRPGAPGVFRAQAHPARRPGNGDFEGSAWSIHVQDATGAWSPVIATGSANPGNDVDDRAAAARTVPQLMPVGVADPRMFACAGLRTEDDTARTTSLIELTPANPAANAPAGARLIQDVLYGDDRFVPNAPGPLIGPANPPTPTIRGPGDRARNGAATCAMVQSGDDVATRELHMLAIDGGALYHSMASDWGATTSGSGSFTFDRFRAISPWADVGQALGVNFGTILDATVVASRPNAVSVFFVARDGSGRHRLWHAVRFSAGGGAWRPADDVLALSGGSPNGAVDPFKVAAGVCPMFGEEAAGAAPDATELVYVMYRPDDRVMTGGRIVSTPRAWSVGLPGTHSPLASMTSLLSTTSDPTRMHTLDHVVIATRPFPGFTPAP